MRYKNSFRKTINNIKISFPIICGVLMLISLINPALKNVYPKIFTGNYLIDPIIGALAGSFSFGIPITSYVAGGELLKKGVSLLAVTAFIMAWTTVGIAMLPLESKYLGKKFALIRNSLNFIWSITIAILANLILRYFG